MGICESSELSPEELHERRAAKARSIALEISMGQDHDREQQVAKMLLLGTGESGKSTLFKQMTTLYGAGFPDSERRLFESIIYNNIITSMKTLLQFAENFNKPVQTENGEAVEFVLELKGNEVIDEELGDMLKALWADPGIQSTYGERSRFQLTDSAAYFFDDLDRVLATDYLPSKEDIIRCRVRTTCIVEQSFDIEGIRFQLFDVGGQRNERRKWVHCFENVTGLLFVAALSEYDQVLYEDENTNRMAESLNLFDEIANSRWFRRTAIILFLNKCDLLEEKLKTVPITTCELFSDYTGEPHDYAASTEYLKTQFLKRNRDADRQIYAHVTCATDGPVIFRVFRVVTQMVIRHSLSHAGLV